MTDLISEAAELGISVFYDYGRDGQGAGVPVLLLAVREVPKGAKLRSVKVRFTVDGREEDRVYWAEGLTI